MVRGQGDRRRADLMVLIFVMLILGCLLNRDNFGLQHQGNFLYANNYVDLVVFDITNPANPTFVKRVKNVFPPENQNYPTGTNSYFQCPDKSKGIVVSWELKNIDAPNCRR